MLSDSTLDNSQKESYAYPQPIGKGPADPLSQAELSGAKPPPVGLLAPFWADNKNDQLFHKVQTMC